MTPAERLREEVIGPLSAVLAQAAPTDDQVTLDYVRRARMAASKVALELDAGRALLTARNDGGEG